MVREIALATLLAASFASAAPREFAPAAADSLIRASSRDTSFRLVDVRTPEEYAAGHLKNAIVVDFRAPDFVQRIAKLPRKAKILIYCRSGHRSGLALQKMEALGFTDASHIAGGFAAWSSQGFPFDR